MLELLLVAVVQIITEMAPISSSGHWRLVELLEPLKWFDPGFAKATPGRQAPSLGVGWNNVTMSGGVPRYFDEFLHLYALIIIAWFFRRAWLPTARSPISPSISARGVSAATESTTTISTAPERTS